MTPYPCLLAALITVCCIQGTVQAQVLRCEDAQGQVTYTDTRCPGSKEVTEVVPALTPEEQARQDALYQQALARKREAQQLQAERDLAQQRREAAEAAQRPAPTPAPVVVPVPVPVPVPASEPTTTYVPVPYPVRPPYVGPPHGRPPHVRPPPPPPQPPPALNCNVFRCYDGKGNTWSRP